MCKTFEAIHKIAKKLQKMEQGGEYIKVVTYDNEAKGMLFCCMEGHDCHDGVITLKDVKISKYFPKTGDIMECKWHNIPTRHITSFAFITAEEM